MKEGQVLPMDLMYEFQKYLADERNLSINTVKSYLYDLNQFVSFIDKPLETVGLTDISNFISYLRSNSIKTSSSNRKIAAIKSFFKTMVTKGYLTNDPAHLIESGKTEQRLPHPIDTDNIEKLINSTENLRDRTLLETLYGTGLRRAEVINISKRDISFSNRYLRVIGKGNKERIIPLNPVALDLMEKLFNLHGSKWLFPSRKKPDQHLSLRQVNEIVSKYVQITGLEELDITPHTFRHTFCSTLFENGADIKTIQDMAGHASINTTNNYTKTSLKRNTEEYSRCHPRMFTL